MTVMYGIPNCDSIKKARKWLDANNIEYSFHNYKKDGVSKELVRGWSKELGFENLLNRRGTTWRKLPEDTKDNINEASAIQIMLENPSIIKRPLLDTGSKKLLGFSEEQYQKLFNA